MRPSGKQKAVPLHIQIKERSHYTEVEIIGDFDIYSANDVKDELGDTCSPNVVIDLTGVGFIDSTGLGVLVRTYRRQQARSGNLALVIVDETILRIFQITGLDRVMKIFKTKKEAILSL